MALRTGRIRSTTSGSPPTKSVSPPSRAATSPPPVMAASMTEMSRARHRLASRPSVGGDTVLWITSTPPGRSPPMSPASSRSPRVTSRTWASSKTATQTTSESLPSPSLLSAAAAPAVHRRSTASRRRRPDVAAIQSDLDLLPVQGRRVLLQHRWTRPRARGRDLDLRTPLRGRGADRGPLGLLHRSGRDHRIGRRLRRRLDRRCTP